MKVVNLVIIFNPERTHVLMCKRQKNPYEGKLNFVGGKKELGESDLEAAYRELYEETNISSNDVLLHSVYATQYFLSATELQVYVGRLTHEVDLIEEKNPLIWIPLSENFTDSGRFAGEGNIQHMLANVLYYADTYLK